MFKALPNIVQSMQLCAILLDNAGSISVIKDITNTDSRIKTGCPGIKLESMNLVMQDLYDSGVTGKRNTRLL